MIENLVDRFINYQKELGTIQEKDVEVYRYGYIVFIELLLNSCLSLGIGSVMGAFKEVLFFLFVFIPLRSFCGGYHADKAWRCVILSNFIIIASVLTAKCTWIYKMPKSAKLVVLGTAALCIGIAAPVENENKKMERKEKRKYKWITGVVLLAEVMLAILLLFQGKEKGFQIILISFIDQVILITMALIKAKKWKVSFPE